MSEEKHTSGKVCPTALFHPRLPMQFIPMDLIDPFAFLANDITIP